MISVQSTSRCKVGFIFIGSCGISILRRMVRGHNPDHYPDFYLFGADTDVEFHNAHFAGKGTDIALWVEKHALDTFQIVGEEAGTDGRGTGGNPELARSLALSSSCQAAFTNFMAPLNKVCIFTAVGGGTGSGVAPVVAKLAAQMDKYPVALVVVPEDLEGKVEIAQRALDEIRTHAVTIPLNNSHIDRYLRETNPEQAETMSERECLKVMDEATVVPFAWNLQRILQRAGKDRNIDEKDFESDWKCGKYGGAGVVEMKTEEAQNAPAKEFAQRLVRGHFQDPAIFTRGEVVEFIFEGPWPKKKKDEIELLVKGHLSSSGHKPPEKILVHRWADDDPIDDTLRVGMLVFSGEPKGDMEIQLDSEAGKRNLFYVEPKVEEVLVPATPQAVRPVRPSYQPTHVPAPALATAEAGIKGKFGSFMRRFLEPRAGSVDLGKVKGG